MTSRCIGVDLPAVMFWVIVIEGPQSTRSEAPHFIMDEPSLHTRRCRRVVPSSRTPLPEIAHVRQDHTPGDKRFVDHAGRRCRFWTRTPTGTEPRRSSE